MELTNSYMYVVKCIDKFTRLKKEQYIKEKLKDDKKDKIKELNKKIKEKK